jgi:hypothetical protein
MPTQTHWLDANVFIEAKNGAYGFDICPGFWSFLDSQVALGAIRSPKMVYHELTDSDGHRDELARWIMGRREVGLCVAPTQEVQEAYRRVVDYVCANNAQPFFVEFLRGADGWLVAHALVGKGVVVTHEARWRPNSKKIRIPQVCAAFDVPCIDTYRMLRDLKAEFSMASGSSVR